MFKIRKASKSDSAGISRLTKKFSTTLSRGPEEISRLARNFFVAENQKGKIVGCCGFKKWDSDAEIIALIVDSPYQKKGLASRLFGKVLGQLKKTKSVEKIFVLSTKDVAEKIFSPAGFFPAGIQMFSRKVGEDCRRCRKNRLDCKGRYLCDEIVLVYKNPKGRRNLK
ncbi:MAG: GNAT family N-acetyltransferase [Candidatus Moranbacteria bacterium]|nr:GNAT family N-acetyltransferase [Candidatus Moranbacteria bacterium]